MAIHENIKDNIEKLMLSNNISSVAELARLLNCPLTTIYNLTTMKNKNPSILTIKMISDYFNITINSFISDTGFISLSENKIVAQKDNSTQIQYRYPMYSLSTLYTNKGTQLYKNSLYELKEDTIVVALEKPYLPYRTNDVLYFSKADFNEIDFPILSIIEDNGHRYIERVYFIDETFYVLKNKMFKKEALVRINDIYKDPKIKYILVQIKYESLGLS